MGLSPDPEKRANQLRNLNRGWPTAAHKHGLVRSDPQPADEKPEPETEPNPEPAEPGTLEVVDYQPDPQPRSEPRPARRRRTARPPVDETPPAAEPERRGGVLSELKAGFFGP